MKKTRTDLRATWGQALLTLFGPLVLFFGIRWIATEPFVIPSGSMIPTLRVHDHILVNKFAYGLHVPFGKSWIFQWATPRRNEIIVFRYPDNPEVFYVKRAIGVAGDHISLHEGILKINGQDVGAQSIPAPADLKEDGFAYFNEAGHVVRYLDVGAASSPEIVVPEGHLFVMGDNRDQSSDSRYWGFVPNQNVVGRVWLIWLACDATLPSAQFLCDPSTLRWDRFFLHP